MGGSQASGIALDRNVVSGRELEPGAPAWCAWAWDRLIETLRRLALPADQQVTLTWLGCIPDELALEFYDAYLLVPQLVELGWVSSEQRDALAGLDLLLNLRGPLRRPPRSRVLFIGLVAAEATMLRR